MKVDLRLRNVLSSYQSAYLIRGCKKPWLLKVSSLFWHRDELVWGGIQLSEMQQEMVRRQLLIASRADRGLDFLKVKLTWNFFAASLTPTSDFISQLRACWERMAPKLNKMAAFSKCMLYCSNALVGLKASYHLNETWTWLLSLLIGNLVSIMLSPA